MCLCVPGAGILCNLQRASLGRVCCVGLEILCAVSVNSVTRVMEREDMSQHETMARDCTVVRNSYKSSDDRGGSRGVGGLTPPPKDYPADSEIWRKGVADRL